MFVSMNIKHKLSLLYFVYFALLGAMVPYLGLYLDDIGFDLIEIAQLLSILMLTKILAPFFWATISDWLSCHLKMIRAGSFLTLLSYLGLFLVEEFLGYALVIALFSFFWNAVLPQIEVVTLYNLKAEREKYSRIRLWGSVGFIVSVLVLGVVFQAFGIGLLPYFLLVIILSIFSVSLLSYEEPVSSQGDNPTNLFKKSSSNKTIQGFSQQLFTRSVISFLAICFLLQLSHGVYYTFFSIYLESLDYSESVIGGLWALGVLAEVFLFVWMHKWFQLHSLNKIIVIALFLTSVRWLFTGYLADIFLLLILLQCLHAFSFGAMHAVAIEFVHRHFDLPNQGRAQALYSGVGFGAGGAMGAILAGELVTETGYAGAFALSAVLSFLALFCVSFVRFDRANKNVSIK